MLHLSGAKKNAYLANKTKYLSSLLSCRPFSFTNCEYKGEGIGSEEEVSLLTMKRGGCNSIYVLQSPGPYIKEATQSLIFRARRVS